MVDQPTAAPGLTALITGTPRSGTNNVRAYYRAQGLRVTHERLPGDGQHVDVVIDYHQLNHLDRWPLAIFLTRHPVSVVKSLSGLLARPGQYRRTLTLHPELPEERPIVLAAEYWLLAYERCRHLPVLRTETLPRLDPKPNADHEEGVAGIPSRQLHRLFEAATRLGYDPFREGGP